MEQMNSVGSAQNVTAVNKVKEFNKVNYQPKVDLSDPVDKVEFTTEKEVSEKKASTGKKVGVGIANAFLPGLGQIINGQVGKGLGFMAGTIALGALFGPTAALAIGVVSIVDAVKNAKP